MNLNDIANLNIDGLGYCCSIIGKSKSEAVNFLKKNADLSNKRGSFKNTIFLYCV